jgi:hypothetical protein
VKHRMLNLLSVLAVPVVFMIYLCFTNANRYVPAITITASTDGGKTYTSYLKSLPQGKDIYLKYEVSVKAKGFWQRFFCNVVHFTIEHSNKFELYDFSGKVPTGTAKTIFSSNIMEWKKRKISFSVVAASSAPKKAEILLKLPHQNNEYYDNRENHQITLSFSSPVSNGYDKTITLDFAPHR